MIGPGLAARNAHEQVAVSPEKQTWDEESEKGAGEKGRGNEGASEDVDENKGGRKNDCRLSNRPCRQDNSPNFGRYVSCPPRVGWRDGPKKKNFMVRSRNVYENKGNMDTMPDKIRPFLYRIRTFWFNRAEFCRQKPDFDETLREVSGSDELVTR